MGRYMPVDNDKLKIIINGNNILRKVCLRIKLGMLFS